MSFYKILSYIYSRLASKQNKAITHYHYLFFIRIIIIFLFAIYC